MQLNFTYNKDKDIWCLLNKGKNSNNSQNPTKQYEYLVDTYGENPTVENTVCFIDEYLVENNIDIQKRIDDFQNEWESISVDFQKRAEVTFGTSLPSNVTVYLTINSRCPYSIQEDYFYVCVESAHAMRTVMHELWHFYTWYGLGVDQEVRLGKEKYNDLKEALTVLLNVECKDLLPEGVIDIGYPQHHEIRQRILEYWEKDKNIKNLWSYLVD